MHCRLGDGAAEGLEDEGVRMDDIVGCGRAGVGSRLHARQRTGVLVGAGDDVTQDFCVAALDCCHTHISDITYLCFLG